MTRSFLSSQLYQDRLSSSFSFYDVLASLPKPKYESRRKDFALRLKIPELCKVDASPVLSGYITLSPHLRVCLPGKIFIRHLHLLIRL